MSFKTAKLLFALICNVPNSLTMKTPNLLGLLFSLLLAGCVLEHSPSSELPHPNRDLIPEVIKTSIRERVGAGSNSIALGVIDATGIDFYGAGIAREIVDSIPPDIETIYEIGSITKVFTSTLLTLMVGEGQVLLEDPIASFLPDSITNVRGFPEIYLEHLATHTAGFAGGPGNLRTANFDDSNPYKHYAERDLFFLLKNSPLRSEPGQKFGYSNIGMGLLGKILTIRSGYSYEQLLDTLLLKPLNMRATGTLIEDLAARNHAIGRAKGVRVPFWAYHQDDVMVGAGGIRSSVEDMLKFLAAQLNFDDNQLNKAIATTQLPRVATGDNRFVGLGWGVHLQPGGDTVFTHNGGTGGFRSFLGLVKGEKNLGVVVFSNSNKKVDDLGKYFLYEGQQLDTNFHLSIANVIGQTIETSGMEAANDKFGELLKEDQGQLNRGWRELNHLGYIYISQRQYEKAIAVFKLNTLLHPNSADVFDSLGEGYYYAGNYVEATANYEMALSIDPDFDNAKKMIRKIAMNE